MSTIIYHNPACGTSRNTLAIIRANGTEPVIIEYLKTPLARAGKETTAAASIAAASTAAASIAGASTG